MKNKIWTLIFPLFFILAACAPSPAPVVSEAMPEAAAEEPREAAPPAEPTTEAVTQGVGFCANEFYPLRSDKTWRYSINSAGQVSEYTLTFKDITENSFTILQTFPDLTNEVAWTCSADGMLSSNFASMNLASVADVEFETIDMGGIALLPEEQWLVGASWPMEFQVRAVFTSSGSQFTGEGQVNLTRAISAQESVTVPAGSYPDAFRVDSSGEFIISVLGAQTSTPVSYSDWYVRGVGLVKSLSGTATLPYSMELVAFE